MHESQMKKITGQTKDVGFQFGIRRTFPISPEQAWDFIFAIEGLNIWLGKLDEELELKKNFTTKEGVEAFVRVLKPNSHIRLNWKIPHWPNTSLLQLRVINNKGRATISFHQEKLLNSEQREEVKQYWNEVMDKLSCIFSQ